MPQHQLMALQNMLGHPIKFDRWGQAEAIAKMVNEPGMHLCANMNAVHGLDFVKLLSVKTGLTECRLNALEDQLVGRHGCTLLDVITSVAGDISNVASKPSAIPPGQFCILIIEAIERRCKSGELLTKLPFDMMIKTCLGTDCDICIVNIVKYGKTGIDFLPVPNCIQEIDLLSNTYAFTNMDAKKGQRYMKNLLQLGETWMPVSEIVSHFFKIGICTLPKSYILGGFSKTWGWVHTKLGMKFECLQRGQLHYGFGLIPNNKCKILGAHAWEPGMPDLDAIVPVKMEIADVELTAIKFELHLVKNFVDITVLALQNGTTESWVDSVRMHAKNCGCFELITVMRDFANDIINDINDANAMLMVSAIDHENILDKLVSMQCFLKYIEPEGILGLTYGQIKEAGSVAITPSSRNSSIITISSDNSSNISNLAMQPLRKHECDASKGRKRDMPTPIRCAKKLRFTEK